MNDRPICEIADLALAWERGDMLDSFCEQSADHECEFGRYGDLRRFWCARWEYPEEIVGAWARQSEIDHPYIPDTRERCEIIRLANAVVDATKRREVSL